MIPPNPQDNNVDIPSRSSSNLTFLPPAYLASQAVQIWNAVPFAAKQLIIKLTTEVEEGKAFNNGQRKQLEKSNQKIQELTKELSDSKEKLALMDRRHQIMATQSQKESDDLKTQHKRCQETVTRLVTTLRDLKSKLDEKKKAEAEISEKYGEAEKIILKVMSFLCDAKRYVPEIPEPRDGIISEDFIEECLNQVQASLGTATGVNGKSASLKRNNKRFNRCLEGRSLEDGSKLSYPSSSDAEVNLQDSSNVCGDSSSSTQRQSGSTEIHVAAEENMRDSLDGNGEGVQDNLQVVTDAEKVTGISSPGRASYRRKLRSSKRTVAGPQYYPNPISTKRRKPVSCLASLNSTTALELDATEQEAGRRFRCPKCPSTCARFADLKSHFKRKHENLEWLLEYKTACIICGVFFRSMKALNIHKGRIHGWKKPSGHPLKVGAVVANATMENSPQKKDTSVVVQNAAGIPEGPGDNFSGMPILERFDDDIST